MKFKHAFAIFFALPLIATLPAFGQSEKAPVAHDAPAVVVTHHGKPTVASNTAAAVEKAPPATPNRVTVTVVPKNCYDTSCAKLIVTHNARVNSGALAVATELGSASGSPFAYIALSPDTTAVAAGDTACPSEITTGGLARKLATYGSYTAPSTLGGSASYQLTATYTATAGATVNKLCSFTAASGGTLGFETLLPNSVILNSGDSISITWSYSV